MKQKKIILTLIITSVILSFFFFDLGRFLSLESLKKSQTLFGSFYENHTIVTLATYFAVYVTAAALSLPGATILTLAGGALFGLTTGFLLVSFASTSGATLAFLVSRYMARDAVQKKFSKALRSVNEGMKKEGGFYLFSLRLVPAFPFFLVNLVMGLTPMKTRTFYWISQLGMIPGTLVYVNAGTQLGKLESLSGILSPALIGSFALLGIFPLIVKKITSSLQNRKNK